MEAVEMHTGDSVDPEDAAILIRRAYKQYKQAGLFRTTTNMVIRGLDMTVRKGTIYGLLGASGCGKTTILKAIVGQSALTSGEVRVLGRQPGSPGSGVPGSAVGYMPQELALYGGFTIAETMRYFGWLTGLSKQELAVRTSTLLRFLDLPPARSPIERLSGGQQRRVSFAVALLHRPPVLILDEPTVGVDPVLRQSIWEHLLDIAADGNTTVIITTHYIEEARQAHTIGLMRQGVLLDEDRPDRLLTRYGCLSMEDVFLKLSIRQANKTKEDADDNQNTTLVLLHQNQSIPNSFALKDADKPTLPINYSAPRNASPVNGRHSKIQDRNGSGDALRPPAPAHGRVPNMSLYPETKSHLPCLVWKQILWMRRNLLMVAFLILLPVVQCSLFGLTIGRDPKGLRVAIVNDESRCPSNLDFVDSVDCEAPAELSCRYLRRLRDLSLDSVIFPSEDAALSAVKGGKAWAALHFGANFSDALIARIMEGGDATNSTLDLSEVNVWIDMSNAYIGQLIQADMTACTVKFVQDVMRHCNWNPAAADIPVRFETPIYGPPKPLFLDFVAPGCCLTLIFFMAVASAVGALISEKNEGLLDRSLVMGVTMREVMWSHIIIQLGMMIVQSAIVLVGFLEVFHITNEGPLHWIVLLCIMQGACGMFLGMLVSCVCKTDMEATLLSLGSFFPFIFLSGMMWPLEGMHIFLRYAGWGLPLTLATTSLRYMLSRGWGPEHPDVLYGFISTSVWVVIFMSATLFVLRVHKR